MTTTEVLTWDMVEGAAEELALCTGWTRTDMMNAAYLRAGSRDALGRL